MYFYLRKAVGRRMISAVLDRHQFGMQPIECLYDLSQRRVLEETNRGDWRLSGTCLAKLSSPAMRSPLCGSREVSRYPVQV